MKLVIKLDGTSNFTNSSKRETKSRTKEGHSSTPMLAKRHNGTPVRGWWMSEKLDGVRAIWNGSEFISRNGKTISAPSYMKEQMPTGIKIDGELFGGRGNFQTTAGKVRSGDLNGLTFCAFDIINTRPLEDRQATLRALQLPAFCAVVEQIKCSSADHLDKYEQGLIDQGAEGVMLRKPRSLYQHKRSSDLLKVKRFKTEEAEVVGYQEGKGKHANRNGALVAKFKGQTFKIGTGMTDDERETPPAIGSVVTFSFFELTDGGKPRFPIFIGVRNYE